MSQSDPIWEHYAKDGGVFHSHHEPNYVTQQYINHLEDECERLKSEVDELRKRFVVSDNPTCEWCGDIVTRLREELLTIERHGTESLNDLDHAHLLVAAADEIERLRNLSGEVLESLNEMVVIEMLTVITPRLRDSAQALEKAVRGD